MDRAVAGVCVFTAALLANQQPSQGRGYQTLGQSSAIGAPRVLKVYTAPPELAGGLPLMIS
jgi:hypothetical protein